MPLYEVEVTRWACVTQIARVEVEARDEEDAREAFYDADPTWSTQRTEDSDELDVDVRLIG